MSKIWSAWTKFWFEANYKKQLALFEPIFYAMLFIAYIPRQHYLADYYFQTGFIYHHSTLSDQSLAILHFIFLGLCLVNVSRFKNPITKIGVWGINLYFLKLNTSFLYGFDDICNTFLFYLCFVNIKWSGKKEIINSIAFRFLQVQIGIIYFVAGLSKFLNPFWMSGGVLKKLTLNPQMFIFNYAFPNSILIAAAICVASFELIFPLLLAWNKKTRVLALMGGFIFHLMIGINIPIEPFAALMCVSYIVFFEDEWIVNLKAKIQTRIRKPSKL